MRQGFPVDARDEGLPHLDVLQNGGFAVEGEQEVRRLEGAENVDILHLLCDGQVVFRRHAGRINLPGLECVNDGLGFHLPVRYLVQLGFLAPPFFIGHKCDSAAVVVEGVHLVWAGAPLRVRVLQVALVEGLWVGYRRVHELVKQGLPPGEWLFECDHGLLVGFAGGDTFD